MFQNHFFVCTFVFFFFLIFCGCAYTVFILFCCCFVVIENETEGSGSKLEVSDFQALLKLIALSDLFLIVDFNFIVLLVGTN